MVAAGRLFKLCCRYTLLSAATLSITLGVPGKSEAVNPAALVADINGTATSSLGLTGTVLATLNGTTFFAADDGVHGMELWQSDGTAAGTVMVKDILTGADGSNPRYLTNVNGVLFLVADDGVHGPELWKSDGTEAGTVMVKNIRPNATDSNPKEITNVDGTLYFSADNGIEVGISN